MLASIARSFVFKTSPSSACKPLELPGSRPHLAESFGCRLDAELDGWGYIMSALRFAVGFRELSHSLESIPRSLPSSACIHHPNDSPKRWSVPRSTSILVSTFSPTSSEAETGAHPSRYRISAARRKVLGSHDSVRMGSEQGWTDGTRGVVGWRPWTDAVDDHWDTYIYAFPVHETCRRK
ncbi:hypothetical protein BJ912DRAFT_958461, partial [Pholiota molesta]